MKKKEPSLKNRLKMLNCLSELGLSRSTISRVHQSFARLGEDQTAREELAAEWVNRLQNCRTEEDVTQILTELTL